MNGFQSNFKSIITPQLINNSNNDNCNNRVYSNTAPQLMPALQASFGLGYFYFFVLGCLYFLSLVVCIFCCQVVFIFRISLSSILLSSYLDFFGKVVFFFWLERHHFWGVVILIYCGWLVGLLIQVLLCANMYLHDDLLVGVHNDQNGTLVFPLLLVSYPLTSLELWLYFCVFDRTPYSCPPHMCIILGWLWWVITYCVFVMFVKNYSNLL